MDPVALAFTAVGAGLAAGLAVVGGTVAALDAMRPAAGSAAAPLGLPLFVLAAGTLGGLVLAGVVTWRLLAPLQSTYRRGGLAMVAAFATVPVMQLYQPLDGLLGTRALLGAAAIAATAAWLLGRRARRMAAA
jgi:hypothetical protein